MSSVDRLDFFVSLADNMNAHPERFTILGDADMNVVIEMTNGSEPFRVGLAFEGLRCADVVAATDTDAKSADYRLVGTVSDWTEMFGDIKTHGRATGQYTINSLALLGDRIRLLGDDPMGLDKFSRFNQTLQEFLDGV